MRATTTCMGTTSNFFLREYFFFVPPALQGFMPLCVLICAVIIFASFLSIKGPRINDARRKVDWAMKLLP